MRLAKTIPAAGLAVSLERAKQQVAVAAALTHHDDHLRDLIAAASEQAEIESGRAILTSTYTLTLDRFPCGSGKIYLPRPPLVSVASIVYLDDAGDEQTLDETVYRVVPTAEPAELILRYGQVWPTTYPESAAVTVTYTAGHGDTADDFPAAANLLQAGILLLVQAYWLRDLAMPWEKQTEAASKIFRLHRCGDDFLEYDP